MRRNSSQILLRITKRLNSNAMVRQKVLLVEPNYPIPAKSRNHKNFLPIGLLKIASYLKSKNIKIELVRGFPKDPVQQAKLIAFKPSEIWITSLFTYWSKYVREAVQYYKAIFPRSTVVVGGIYASLMPRHCKEFTDCDSVYVGVMKEAEGFAPAYELIENSNPTRVDYQIIHTSRGCKRKCKFCGTWKIEPKSAPKKTIIHEVKYQKLVFYDNNLLENPFIENILDELIELRRNKKIRWCESQSGFDGRLLLKKPVLARLLKNAGFRYPRIAWDWQYMEYPRIKRQIDTLFNAGYQLRDIFVFMLYNWDFAFEKMERKRLKCWEWKVQIADCRYRPLDQTFDNYDSRKIGQTNDDYYIHESGGWTDALVKQFRKNVRRQNICVRHGFPFYSKDFEHKITQKKTMNATKEMKTTKEKAQYLTKKNISHWFPDKIS